MYIVIYLNVFASTTLLWLSPNATQCIFFTLRHAVPLQTQLQEGMCSALFCSRNTVKSFIWAAFVFLKINGTMLCLDLSEFIVFIVTEHTKDTQAEVLAIVSSIDGFNQGTVATSYLMMLYLSD